MDELYRQALNELAAAGWKIEFHTQPQLLPFEFLSRYPWIPAGYRAFAEAVKRAVSPDETVWLLTVNDFAGTTDSAFVWNEWELQSLEAAGNDVAWQQSIQQFWSNHLPVLTSVTSGYGYFALERKTLAVVAGEAPEFETTSLVAPSFLEALKLLAKTTA